MEMKNKKYKMTRETRVLSDGTILHRIRNLKTAVLGGFIEKETNLSQDGDSWVYEGAQVYGNARVSGDAWVFEDAQVYGNAQVSRDARVFGNAQVFGNAWVSDNAQIYGNTWVYGNARVFGNARIPDGILS